MQTLQGTNMPTKSNLLFDMQYEQQLSIVIIYESVSNLVLAVDNVPPILVAMMHSKRDLKLGINLVKFMILGMRLCMYQHLLCSLSFALAGLIYQFLGRGLSIYIFMVHPITTATVHAKEVVTRQKNIQVINQNIHCLAPAMMQASSILRAAKEFASVAVALSLAFSASAILVCVLAVGDAKWHSLGLCMQQAL